MNSTLRNGNDIFQVMVRADEDPSVNIKVVLVEKVENGEVLQGLSVRSLRDIPTGVILILSYSSVAALPESFRYKFVHYHE
jgi:hypothetical protein